MIGGGDVRSEARRYRAQGPLGLAALTVALLAVVFGAAGCFDVHSVDPGPYVIDDFENGTVQPLDSLFAGWFCGGDNP